MQKNLQNETAKILYQTIVNIMLVLYGLSNNDVNFLKLHFKCFLVIFD
jgi:hypothetical protein